MENSISPVLFAILIIAWTLLLISASYFVSYLRDRLKPDDPYSFLHEYLGRKIEVEHPDFKAKVQGHLVAITLAKGKAKGGKKRYDLVVNTGRGEVKIDIYSRTWRFV